jgi:hypothetical protein
MPGHGNRPLKGLYEPAGLATRAPPAQARGVVESGVESAFVGRCRL